MYLLKKYAIGLTEDWENNRFSFLILLNFD